jgi:hypothetical protein
MTSAPRVVSAGRPVPEGAGTHQAGGEPRMTMESVEQGRPQGHSTAAADELLLDAIFAIARGTLDHGPKLLLVRLFDLAGANGEPVDCAGVTFPQLGEDLGCEALTIQELAGELEQLGAIVVARRLFRGERDERAPSLGDGGGTVLYLNRERILELAYAKRQPLGTRYRPVSRPALEQWARRQRELEAELARLREGQRTMATQLDTIVAASATPGAPPATRTEALALPRRRRKIRGGGGQGGAQGGSGGVSGSSSSSGGLRAAGLLASPLRDIRPIDESRRPSPANDVEAAAPRRDAA